MRTSLAWIFVFALLVACDNDSPTDRRSTSLPIESLARFSSSGYAGPQRLAIHDGGELQRVWQIVTAGQSPQPPLPAVDFRAETVILAAAGERSNGCYSIDVSAVRLTRLGSLDVEVTETVPGPDCACLTVITRPIHLVSIPRVSGRQVFTERTRQLRC